MTPNNPDQLRVLVLADDVDAAALERELAPALESLAHVVTAAPGKPLPTALRDDGVTALVLMVARDEATPTALDTRVEEVGSDPDLASAEILILTDRPRIDDLSRSLDTASVAGIIAIPWRHGGIADQARSHLARWLRTHDDTDPRLAALDLEGRAAELPDSELLRDLELDDVAIAERLVAAIEQALGRRPRVIVTPGTRLTREGTSVDALFVLLRGSVALERSTREGSLRLHHGSTGPVIGLLSLAQQRRAFFTAIATTEAELVHINLEQLDLALDAGPEVPAALAAIAIKGLAQRLRRSEQLQLERIELNRDLERERAELTRTLAELEATRDELVRQARLASLGELAAGVAHELNNPVAALTRAASYVTDDAGRLLEDAASGELADLVQGARHRPALTTAHERDLRRQITAVVDDPELARELVTAGVSDPDRATRIVAAIGDRDRISAAVGLGTALRNLEVSSHRIAELVDSLRTYARPGQDRIAGVDLHQVADDALRLVGHRLRDLTVHREYAPLPTVRGHPAELGQVVTNLLANAADAAESTVTLRTFVDGDDAVLEVIDDGPGLSSEQVSQLEQPRFTTKQGTVRFGLGLGLSIVRRIVDAHEGRFDIRSSPGRTVASVRLPSDEVR